MKEFDPEEQTTETTEEATPQVPAEASLEEHLEAASDVGDSPEEGDEVSDLDDSLEEDETASDLEVSLVDGGAPHEEDASEADEGDEEVETDEQVDDSQVKDDGRAWYVVHCYSGYENKVRHNLEQRIETMGMKDRIFDVVVPTEEEIEVREGKRRTVERRVFPGYILVNLILSEESWYVVRNTPGVTGFVGMGNEPTPLRPEEVAQIIKRMEADAPRVKVTFKSGERVRIVDGPFNDFRGTVAEIDMDRTKVRVMVNFFGRETPVELDFLQVEKA
jgi:transcriptional antiterminator NusG